jgi:hypothetical protein
MPSRPGKLEFKVSLKKKMEEFLYILGLNTFLVYEISKLTRGEPLVFGRKT